MIELPLNVARYKHMLERLLVPVGIWKGGWLLQVWEPKEGRWKRSTLDIQHLAWMLGWNLEDGYFLWYENSEARFCLLGCRELYPGRRFRLKPIKARQILDFYHDLIWKPDAPERLLLECWGDFSPLWRILGRAPA